MDSIPFKASCSETGRSSRLVQAFARRAGDDKCASPEETIRAAISRLRRLYRGEPTLDERMRFYLANRRIVSARIVDQLSSDAALEPIGSRYVHGFNILLTRQRSYTRLRFTLAHEICHTFFYEFVPEVKFMPHQVDAMEERLCDFGAAELLMPTSAVKKNAAERPVCIHSLRMLAEQFSVSVAAMFLRLRSLRLWNCVLSEWHRMLNGEFELTRFYGGKRVPWQWEDPSILNDAWQSHKSSFGNTFVRYEAQQGRRFYFPARFEVQRVGNRIFSLWGAQIERPTCSSPLFSQLAS